MTATVLVRGPKQIQIPTCGNTSKDTADVSLAEGKGGSNMTLPPKRQEYTILNKPRGCAVRFPETKFVEIAHRR